jgi:hypothetical protein
MDTRPELYKRLVYTEWLFSGLVFMTLLILPESPRELAVRGQGARRTLTASTFSLVVAKRQTRSRCQGAQAIEWRYSRLRHRTRTAGDAARPRRDRRSRGSAGQKGVLLRPLQGDRLEADLDLVFDLGMATDNWYPGRVWLYRL